MQAAAGHEPQSGVKCACARETTASMSSWQGSSQRLVTVQYLCANETTASWQGSSQRHSTVFVHARMKPQPHAWQGSFLRHPTLFVPTMQL